MIRAYTQKDKSPLIEILRLNTPAFFHPEEEEDFRNYLEHHAQNYFVMEEGNTIVGAGGINYFDHDKTARISWDLIHPSFQSRGFGSELTRFRIEQIRQNPEIETIMVRTTQLVYPFYQKCGFKLVKNEKDFWAKGFDLYLMILDIKK